MEKLTFTVFGIFLTLAIQWLGNKSRVRHEDLKIHSEKLSIERLKVYPSLYKLLSESVKHLHFPRMYSEKFDLKLFENCLNDWDSNDPCR